MKKKPLGPDSDPQARITALVRDLRKTEEQLQKLTEGEVDAVIHPGGHAYLLHKAQQKLQQSAASQRELAETQMAILNAMSAHVALLDSQGVIISVNDSWRKFAAGSGVQGTEFFVGQNYPEICERATGDCAEDAHAVAAGIRRVLQGEANEFNLEYPCHSPTEQKWFRLTVTPVREDQLSGVVVMHLDITERRLAEAALRKSEEQFRNMFVAAATGIAVSTPQGRFLQVNGAYCRMLGYTEQELLALDFASVTHPDDLDHNLRMRDEILAGQRDSFVMEKRYLKKNGDTVWTSHSVSATRDVEGKVLTFVVVAEDITERKRSEAQRQQQQTELQVLFDLMPALIWLKDTENRILRINRRAAEATGKPIEELEGKSMYEIYPVDAAKYYADDLEVINSGAPKLEIIENLRSTEGRQIWVQTDKVPVFDGNGKVYGIVVMVQDITERKVTEARIRRLIDSNTQGVFFWNANGAITGSNDAFLQIVGYSREDLQAGRLSWKALTPPEYGPLDQQALDEIATKGVCKMYEKEYVRKDGSRVPILVGGASFEDNPDEGVRFVLDLTERKKLEQQFFRAQRMESIGTLAGGIAHDLNNILAPILMSIHLLQEFSDHPQSKDILETIEISAKRGADIVRQVLSFARGMEGERIEVQPRHLLKDLEHIVKDTFPKDIRLKFAVPNNAWMIFGDPTQIHQILLNLCVNARDAMPNGGNLSVSIENCVLDEQYVSMNLEAKPGRYVQISVTDSGIGMPREIIEKIFEPFFTTKELNKGTGLGLSTVMAIVKSHEGIINVYSEPGQGTTFKVYLPAVDSSSQVGKQVTGKVSLVRGKGETILLVDDEASIVTITTKTLQSFGYRVLSAGDGAEGVALYAGNKDEIAVVLTDMTMPVMDGVAMIHALRRINPAVKVIAASGLNANGSANRMAVPGVKHFLTKPYTAETLLHLLRSILDETTT